MEFRIRSQTIIIHKISNIQNKRQFTKHKKGHNHKITALEAEAGAYEPHLSTIYYSIRYSIRSL